MINLYNGDCMDALRKMKDNQYDLAIVDPPYGIGIANKVSFYSKKGVGHSNPHTPKNWDSAIPSAKYFVELKRISRNQIIWGGNYFTEHLPPSRGWIFWDKIKYVDNYADGELAWTSFDRNTKQIRHQHHGFLNSDGRSIHPTQKPVALYKWLLDNYAKEGDKILDTHGGSMSIAIACHDMKFDLDLYELDKDYFDTGKKRLENHQLQQQFNL
jgi:site-specific DNA-methyltransferase (adenine-specific)